jgi:hypothetical protein
MSYELTWYSAGEVLQLDLQNSLSLDEMRLVNQRTIDMLDGSDQKLILLIDVSALAAAYHTVEQLRITQQYRDHPNLDAIVVVSKGKLNRLVTLLAFNLSRARFVQFNSTEQAQLYIQNRRSVM